MKGVISLIGEILRKERENQRMTIQDIEDGTSIRAAYIEAIESGDYDKMPGRVYAKGFVKNYANFLNLNGDEIVKQFMAEVSPPAPVVEQAQNVTAEEPKGKSTFSVSGKRIAISEEGFNIGNLLSGNNLVAAIVAVVLIVGGIFYYTKDSGTEIAKVDTQPVTQEVQTQPAAQPQTAPQPQQPIGSQASAAVPPQVDGVNVQATFSGDCWILVTTDGNVIYEGVITAGQVMDWKGNENVNVRLGNAGAVDFVMNGQNFGKLGGEGDVVDKTFTK